MSKYENEFFTKAWEHKIRSVIPSLIYFNSKSLFDFSNSVNTALLSWKYDGDILYASFSFYPEENNVIETFLSICKIVQKQHSQTKYKQEELPHFILDQVRTKHCVVNNTFNFKNKTIFESIIWKNLDTNKNTYDNYKQLMLLDITNTYTEHFNSFATHKL